LDPEAEIQRHSAWRTSPAVEKALEILLDTPVAPATSARVKKAANNLKLKT
jgi:hypothetical protein